MKEKIRELKKILNKSQKILLINHVRMDPDAFGSLTAFYEIFKILKKDVKAINDDKIPENFFEIYNSDIIDPNLNIKKFAPDLIIALDTSSLDRLGKIYENNIVLFKNTTFVEIDHHISNIGFAGLDIVDSESSSTCELLYEILVGLGYKKYINKKIATLLITGIITDTNIYYNSNTSPKTLKIAGELLELGADFRIPIFEFYKKREYNKTKLWGEILKDINKNYSGELVWVTVTRDQLQQTNTTDCDIRGIIGEFLANIEGVNICFIIYELENGETKVSFRGSERYDVSEICTFFGGGGHKQAAGFSTKDSIKETEKEILKKLYNDFKL